MRRTISCVVAAVLLAAALQLGCTGLLAANLTEELAGDINVIFNNTTPFRAAFSIGAFDDLDRNIDGNGTPGPVDFQQQTVEADSATDAIAITCQRDFAIGTQTLIDRVVATDADSVAGFDPDSFVTVVNFSSADADSDAANLPTAGTAAGRIFRVGNDYSCGDTLILTFIEDATATGGFRIESELIQDIEDDA